MNWEVFFTIVIVVLSVAVIVALAVGAIEFGSYIARRYGRWAWLAYLLLLLILIAGIIGFLAPEARS